MKKKKNTLKQEEKKTDFFLPEYNYKYIAIGFGIILFGFLLMIGGENTDPNNFYPDGDPSKTPAIFSFVRITLAPMIVLAGFIFEIWAIMRKEK